MGELLVLCLAGAGVALFLENARAREIALQHCRRACFHARAQLLDETVTLERVRLARDPLGRACLRRTYGFEYTFDGERRLTGLLVLRGRGIELLRLEEPGDGSVPEGRP